MVKASTANDAFNYLLCRWSELCCPTAPLTVSAPLLNSYASIKELLELESAKLTNDRIRMSADVLIEEVAELLVGDPVAREIGGPLTLYSSDGQWRTYLQHGQEEQRNWQKRKSQCKTLMSLLEPSYLDTAVTMIEEFVEDTQRSPLTRWQEVERMLPMVAAQALCEGFDARFLFGRAVQTNRIGSDDVTRFFNRLRHTENRYDVYFKLRGEALSSAVRLPRGISRHTGAPPSSHPQSVAFFGEPGAQLVCVEDVPAADEHSAGTLAYRELHKFCAFLGASHRREVVRPDIVCVLSPRRSEPDRRYYTIEVSSSATHYAPLQRETMAELLDKALSDPRLTSTALLAARASSEISLELRFLLLWMALEQLVTPGGSGSSTMAVRMAEPVASVVAFRAPERSITAITYRFALMADDGKTEVGQALGIDSEAAADGFTPYRVLREAFAAGDTGKLDALQEALKEVDLVGYVRLATLRRQGPWDEWRRKRAQTDFLRVSRQVNRLTRIRNLLVHNNLSIDSYECVRHLEFYLGECLGAVLSGMEENQGFDVADVLELERLRCEHARK